ncbi:MAG: NADH-quinone oxidoreductase subunit I [Gemmatimonadota bacterium]|nr:NADH-quinone oxidoreductase subunit I [Gemmatimonadota bacterium]
MGNITVKRIDTGRRMTFLERIWLPEILRGIWITNRHFVVNICYHILNLVGIKTARKGAVTIQYPEEHRGYHYRLRTCHYLTHRDDEDGGPRCVGCMMCETVCPARCISIVAGEHLDPGIEKQPLSFTIDMGRCVFCGFCVEACPEDAIRMDSGRIEISSYTREGMTYDLDRLLSISHDPAPYKDYDKYREEAP